MATRKKSTSKKKSTQSGPVSSTHKAAATRTRNELTARIKEDLKATQVALKAANKAAREEIRLAKAAAKAEIAVLKDQLKAAHKREQELLKVGELKVKAMWKAGEEWEKKQMAKLKSLRSK